MGGIRSKALVYLVQMNRTQVERKLFCLNLVINDLLEKRIKQALSKMIMKKQGEFRTVEIPK
jgi:hypothetical protein